MENILYVRYPKYKLATKNKFIYSSIGGNISAFNSIRLGVDTEYTAYDIYSGIVTEEMCNHLEDKRSIKINGDCYILTDSTVEYINGIEVKSFWVEHSPKEENIQINLTAKDLEALNQSLKLSSSGENPENLAPPLVISTLQQQNSKLKAELEHLKGKSNTPAKRPWGWVEVLFLFTGVLFGAIAQSFLF